MQEEVVPADRGDWQAKLQGFLADDAAAGSEPSSSDEESDAEAAEEAKHDQGARNRKLIPNAVHVRALDHALGAGVGHALAHFQCTTPVQALAATDERFFVAPETVPGYTLADRAGVPDTAVYRRSCVQDMRTKATRLEVPDLQSQACLWQVPDQGPVGWSALFWQYCHMHVFGWFMEDPHHRCWSDTKLAFKA